MRRLLKWLGIGVAGLAIVVALASGGVVVVFKRAMAQVHDVAVDPLAIPTDEASIAEGARLVKARGCAECHGPDLGGRYAVEDPVLGRIWAPNITPGSGSAVEGYRVEDWVRAVRHGVKRDGTPTILMPADELFFLDDRELGAIIAYLQRAPVVDRERKPHEFEPLLYVLGVTGQFPLFTTNDMDHGAPRPASVDPAPTAAFGAYLARIQCTGCHGAGLGGGPFPGAPPSLPVPANLTPDPQTGLGGWTEAEFSRALREGRRPDGRELDPFMPWKTYSHLDETEVAALWAYLQSIPAKPFGSR
ncbi:MAG TPA: cytochrome c [Vulgatibacter sp.]|nr:cytochrome c [Vulgatibacter sp.]